MKWPPPDPVLLALALDRAADRPIGHRSDEAPEGYASVEDIAAHAEWSEWGVQTGCRRLVKDGLATRWRGRYSTTLWGLTPDGDAWLADIPEEELPELPECPAHRRWREEREEAERELPGLREAVRVAAQAAAAAAEAVSLEALGLKRMEGRGWPVETPPGSSVSGRVEAALDDLGDALFVLGIPEPPA